MNEQVIANKNVIENITQIARQIKEIAESNKRNINNLETLSKSISKIQEGIDKMEERENGG